MSAHLAKTQAYLQTITSKKHKIVKFIESSLFIRAQKVFNYEPACPEVTMLYLIQLNHIKQYLRRRHELTSDIQVQPYLQINSESCKGDYLTLKANTPFIEHPTLAEYFQYSSHKESHRYLKGPKLAIHYLESLFQLIVRAEGIQNYFYTAQNIFINPPKESMKGEFGHLELNLLSTAGIKFLFRKGRISSKEFLQILPSLPPNTRELQDEDRIDELNILMKIRGFSFNVLCFILRRIPPLTEEKSISHLVDPSNDINIYEIIEKLSQEFKLLFQLQEKTLEKFKNDTNIEITKFLTLVFIDNDVKSWPQVYEYFFLKNKFNLDSYQLSLQNNKQHCELKVNRQYFDQMVTLIWKQEPAEQKQRYKRLGISEGIGSYVYLLVKCNIDFHRQLKYPNLIEFFRTQRYSQDASSIVNKLIEFLRIDPSENETSKKPKGREENLEQYNPLSLSAPTKDNTTFAASYFIQNVLTYGNRQELVKGGERTVNTVDFKYDVLNKYQQALWLV